MVPARTGRSADELVRAVGEPATEAARLQQGVELVVQLLPGADHVGVTVSTPSSTETAAASDELCRQGDAWQYELDEGPCLDAGRLHTSVLSQDLRTDARWGTWAPRVVDGLGVHSMLSLLLYARKDAVAVLNLYGDRLHAWDSEQVVLAQTLAEHLAVVATDAREIENRGQSMITRTMIGQAEGILMERFGLSTQRAFEYLRRISQTNHTKLVDVAREIVETRTLPPARHPQPRAPAASRPGVTAADGS